MKIIKLPEKENSLFLIKGQNRTVLDEVEALFKSVFVGHSHYQIKNFIIGQFERCSADRAHRQCLTEIHTRYQNLVELHYRYRKFELELRAEDINLRQATYKLENVATEPFDKERLELNVEMAHLEKGIKEVSLVNVRKSISETMREIKHFKEEMDRLAPLRKFPGNYEQAESEYWCNEFVQRFAQGKRGENLPPIPESEKDSIIASMSRRLEEAENAAKTHGLQKQADPELQHSPKQ